MNLFNKYSKSFHAQQIFNGQLSIEYNRLLNLIASQYLVLGAKCNAIINGKYSPDIEDVQAVAKPVLRHRMVRNFKAEAEGISVDEIIEKLLV